MDRVDEIICSAGMPEAPRLILWVKFSLKDGASFIAPWSSGRALIELESNE